MISSGAYDARSDGSDDAMANATVWGAQVEVASDLECALRKVREDNEIRCQQRTLYSDSDL